MKSDEAAKAFRDGYNCAQGVFLPFAETMQSFMRFKLNRFDLTNDSWSARRERYRPRGKFVVFLFSRARHRCLNRLRNDDRRRRCHHGAACLPRH